MKKLIVFSLLLISIIASGQNVPVEDTTEHFVITEAGKPIGKIVEKMMNKDGGSLVSEDGTVELIIPAGALSKKTTISIQTMTNTFQNGNGRSYRLEPSGIQFQKPVQIVFHSDPEESKDSAQLLMGIAMQDDSGQWYGLDEFTLDTIAKTISGNIDHFSIWATFDQLKLRTLTGEYRLKVKKSVTLGIWGVFADKKEMKSRGLSELKTMVKKPEYVIWYVDGVRFGNAKVGTLKKGLRAESEVDVRYNTYTAPNNIPDVNPVTISVTMKWIIGGDFPWESELSTNILIYDNAYEVKMVASFENMVGDQTITYLDSGSFVVSLESGKAEIIEKVNKNISDKMDFTGRCKFRQLEPGSGYIHIIGVKIKKVIPPASPEGNSWIEIEFIEAPVIIPLLEYDCPPVGKGERYGGTNVAARMVAAGMLRAYPHKIKFEAKKEKAVKIQLVDMSKPSFITTTVEKLPDD